MRRGPARPTRTKWTLRQQVTWVPDADRTSVPAVLVIRAAVVLYLVLILGQVIGNAVVAAVHAGDGTHTDAHLNDWKLPWEVGLVFALVPAYCLLRYGPRARRGSALFTGLVLAAVITAFCWKFTSLYFALACAGDAVLALVLVVTDRLRHQDGTGR